MRINIGGDLVISKEYAIENIDLEIIKLFQDSDLNIVNLEAPLVKKSIKGYKLGPYLKSHLESAVKVLNVLNIHTVTLANNHILDYGEEGMKETQYYLEKSNINYLGIGDSIETSQNTTFIDFQNEKIAIINIAENEWSSADESRGGAHPLNIFSNVKKIREAKELNYKVILIIHGGLEYYHYPIPYIKDLFRFFVDMGADLIIGHHTHCISGYEIYKDIPIYYSLGNFLFTKDNSFDGWYTGTVIQVEIKEGKIYTEHLGISFTRNGYKLKLLKDNERDEYFTQIENINKVINNESLLKNEYINLLEKKTKLYLDFFSVIPFFRNKFIRKLCRKFNINFHSEYSISFILNIIRCETHQSLAKNILSKYLSK